MDDTFKEEFQVAYHRFASSGRRVLGFAYKHFRGDPSMEFSAENPTYPTDGLIFLGLAAIMDPPKDGVRDAIMKCHTGGIKVRSGWGGVGLMQLIFPHHLGLHGHWRPPLDGHRDCPPGVNPSHRPSFHLSPPRHPPPPGRHHPPYWPRLARDQPAAGD